MLNYDYRKILTTGTSSATAIGGFKIISCNRWPIYKVVLMTNSKRYITRWWFHNNKIIKKPDIHCLAAASITRCSLSTRFSDIDRERSVNNGVTWCSELLRCIKWNKISQDITATINYTKNYHHKSAENHTVHFSTSQSALPPLRVPWINKVNQLEKPINYKSAENKENWFLKNSLKAATTCHCVVGGDTNIWFPIASKSAPERSILSMRPSMRPPFPLNSSILALQSKIHTNHAMMILN